MKFRTLMFAVLLSLGLGTAFAQAPGAGQGPGAPGGQRPTAAEREKRCQADPERCARIKERMAKRHDARQARRDEMRKQCEADPKACAEKKAQFREKMKERRAAMKPGQPAAPEAK